MIPVFYGKTEYVPYNEIVDRIKSFQNHSVIGKDQSEEYDMYMIELGDRENPTIFITASLHGTEWQSTIYTMDFLEQLEKNTFPDNEFRDYLIDNFHIACIPVVNPWGYNETTEHAITLGRRNSRGVDINRDFYDFTEKESQNTREQMLRFKPFAYLDSHLIRTSSDRSQLLIVGNGQPETNYLKEIWSNLLKIHSGYDVLQWEGYENLTKGLSRRFMRDQQNDYTPYTLSYITEITRPVNETRGFVAPLTDYEIYNFGMVNIFLFLKTSIQYFKEHNYSLVDHVISPTKSTVVKRNMDGIAYSIVENDSISTIETTFVRDELGIVQSLNRQELEE